jgi:hypothetical protein
MTEYWVIQSGHYYWSETEGWVPRQDQATKYTTEQKELAGEPPNLTNDGVWVWIEE